MRVSRFPLALMRERIDLSRSAMRIAPDRFFATSAPDTANEKTASFPKDTGGQPPAEWGHRPKTGVNGRTATKMNVQANAMGDIAAPR